MIEDELAKSELGRSAVIDPRPVHDQGAEVESEETARETDWVIETVISPFHCLYQDALAFHTQSRLAKSESDASRIARAALLLYVSSAEALIHHAALELGRPELRGALIDPSQPVPLAEVLRLLPSVAAEPRALVPPFDHASPPWPQFAELLALRNSWTYPGPAAERTAFYHSVRRDGDFEPLDPHKVPPALRQSIPPDRLAFPRTGLPRDPYALRPRHLDTARGVLDAAIDALDRRMAGALTRDQRHRREPVCLVHPSRLDAGA
jgi:hypothetical protein